MKLEPARAAVQALAGVEDVVVCGAPADRALRATAPLHFDWAAAAARLQAQRYWITVLRADDLAVNLQALADAESALPAGDRDARQQAWTIVARNDGSLLAERLVWQALDALRGDRARLWDPRLDELVALADANAAFWRAAAPALSGQPVVLPAPPFQGPLPAAAPADLPGRVQAARAVAVPEAEAAAYGAAATAIGNTSKRQLAMRLCLDRIATVATAVAAHAEPAAARTQAAARAADYRALAARCRELATAANVLLGR